MDIRDYIGHGFFGALVVLALIGVYAIVQPHHITRYYLSTTENGGICVLGDIDWQQDDTVFVTDDVNKAIDVSNKLNKSLEK